jgi:hypothetical protein
LWIGGNRLGDAGARALARSPNLARLRLLDLSSNGIGDAGALALAESPHLSGLTELDLDDNPISEQAMEAVRRRYGPIRVG